MNYSHLSIEERTCIYQLRLSGVGIRSIARAIKRHPSNVARELKRNHCGKKYTYLPYIEQKKYHKRRLNSQRTIGLNETLKDYLEEKLNRQWSHEQIAKRKQNNVPYCPSFSTIYRWLHQKLILQGDMTKLRRKETFKRPQETCGRFNIGKSIRQRPKDVYKRKDLGHWEVDTVESGRHNHQRKSPYCFVTLAERKSRFYLVKLLPNRKSATVSKAMIELLSQFPSDLVKTITCDRGKEFSQYERIEAALSCNMYFADPYCAWKKELMKIPMAY